MGTLRFEKQVIKIKTDKRGIIMKLTYLIWGYPYDKAILKAWKEMGILVNTILLSHELIQNWEEKKEIQQKEKVESLLLSLKEQIRAAAGDMVFSVNFLSFISDFCQREAIPYCSWILQLPNFDLYTASVRNGYNYFFVCDSYLVEKLWQLGITNAFFLPDAVEVDSVREIVPMEREVCFLAKCPEDVLNTKEMSIYSKGYLDAFIHAQRVLYGAYILENGLLLRVQQEFLKGNILPENLLLEMQKLFVADRYFAPVCTRIQQQIFLQNFASIMTIYSNGEFPDCNSKKKALVEDEIARKKIYAGKEFTLVLAPHTLHNGIPRDTLEVIAAGGFPIVGFQRDYAYFFKRDETLVYFTNPAEFSRAIVRYGNHIEERERVKEAAYQKLIEGHTYWHRIAAILEVWKK